MICQDSIAEDLPDAIGFPTEDLEKAVRHFHRAPAGGYGNYQGGQFVTRALVEEEVKRAYDAMPALLEEFDIRLQAWRELFVQNSALIREGTTKVKLVPLTTIEARIKADVGLFYARSLVLGKRAAGDLRSATPADVKVMDRIRSDEHKYLRAFLGDMKDGSGVMPYEERMGWYSMAARELFWTGFVLANPGVDRTIRWVYGDTVSHCRDCQRFAEHGPYPIEEFKRDLLAKGYVPQSGRLACVGKACRCWLEDGHGHFQPHVESPAWLAFQEG